MLSRSKLKIGAVLFALPTLVIMFVVLRQHDARATFFLITDHIPGNEETLVRMLKEGHELGNHLTADHLSELPTSHPADE